MFRDPCRDDLSGWKGTFRFQTGDVAGSRGTFRMWNSQPGRIEGYISFPDRRCGRFEGYISNPDNQPQEPQKSIYMVPGVHFESRNLLNLKTPFRLREIGQPVG